MNMISRPTIVFEREGTVGIIEIDNPPVNASSLCVRRELVEVLARISGDVEITAVVICCKGKTFMAGGDITEFDAPGLLPPHSSEVFEALDSLDCTVVAALHGTVLGGGMELALACDFRVALTSTRLGLPEVKLGVLPGGGGTQRLPRLVGVPLALDLMITGRTVDASQAQQLGLVDVLVDGDLRAKTIAFAIDASKKPRSKRRISEMPLDYGGLAETYFSDLRATLAPEDSGGNAAHQIVSCVKFSLNHSFIDSLRFERAAFEVCRESPESKALRHIFFAEREVARIPNLAGDMQLGSILRVGIVGAGTMGVGIAVNFANAGLPVVLTDVSPEALTRGIAAIRRIYEGAVKKGRMSPKQLADRMALFSEALDDSGLADCDLVVEAAFEDLDLKKILCRRLGQVCKPGAIIASNTSSLNIDVLADASGRPSDFLGMHFFSPAHIMKLLEVVRGARTSPQALATVMGVAKKIGKIAVVSGVCFGFIGNRMLEGYLRETEFLLLEGASPSQIDRAMEGIGMAMGPCRMIDMAGVDVAAKVVLEQLRANRAMTDPCYRVVVRRLNEVGRHGQKTAAGYYRYEGRTAIDDPVVREICQDLAKQHRIARRNDICDAEIVERCLYPLINEGTRILEEGIAYRSGDIDVVWVHGYGFPAYRGGPMHMAGVIGAGEMVRRMTAYGMRSGNSFGYWTASAMLSEAGLHNRDLGQMLTT